MWRLIHRVDAKKVVDNGLSTDCNQDSGPGKPAHGMLATVA